MIHDAPSPGASGHSTNLRKLKRNAAFTRYSNWSSPAGSAEGTARRAITIAQQNARRMLKTSRSPCRKNFAALPRVHRNGSIEIRHAKVETHPARRRKVQTWAWV